jgi:hypothetical protein
MRMVSVQSEVNTEYFGGTYSTEGKLQEMWDPGLIYICVTVFLSINQRIGLYPTRVGI